MIKIKKEISVEVERREYAGELREIFEKNMKSFNAYSSDKDIELFFMEAMSLSEKSGFIIKTEIIKYIFITIHKGLYFEDDPLYERVRDWTLWMRDGVHPNVGLNRMFSSADLMIAEGLAGAEYVYAPGFTDAPTYLEGDHPYKGIPEIRALLAELNLKRTYGFGYDEVDQALEGYLNDLRDNHPQYMPIYVEWLIFSFFLGYKFYENPLFRWTPDALLSEGIVGVMGRLHGG